MISHGKTCSTRGGLVIYLWDEYKYKVLIWEGQFLDTVLPRCIAPGYNAKCLNGFPTMLITAVQCHPRYLPSANSF